VLNAAWRTSAASDDLEQCPMNHDLDARVRIAAREPDSDIRVYDVRHVRARDTGAAVDADGFYSWDAAVEALLIRIREEIDRESWVDNGGRFGQVKYLGGHLIVTQTRRNHRKVRLFLESLGGYEPSPSTL
jgi:hypothetical protein